MKAYEVVAQRWEDYEIVTYTIGYYTNVYKAIDHIKQLEVEEEWREYYKNKLELLDEYDIYNEEYFGGFEEWDLFGESEGYAIKIIDIIE